MTLQTIKDKFVDTSEFHNTLHEGFCGKTNAVPELKELRDYVEQNIFGFGERSFYHMWSLIIDEMPQRFSFLEIGVFRGQVTCLIKLLAKLKGKTCEVVGITPLDSTDGHWESDYAKDIQRIHDDFNVDQPTIVKGLSTDMEVYKQVRGRMFDLVYIDGGHTYEVVYADLRNYAPLASKYLVVDDCANKMKIPNGMFAGIEPVSRAVDEYLPPFTANAMFEYYFNVVHNRIWARINT